MKKKLSITMRKGFQMTFENGITASVQWGAGNYCDNHFPKDMDFSFSKDAESNTAEVAAWNEKGNFVTEEVVPNMCDVDPSVIGYLTPEKIVDFLLACRDYKSN